MTRFLLRGSATALICSLTAPAAHADLTAEDVWTEWNNYLTSAGYEVSAQTESSGDTLTISDLTMMIPVPEDDTVVTLAMPSLALVENGDGTVNAMFPASLPIQVTVEGDDTEDLEAVFTMTHSNGQMVISGDPTTFTYTHSSDLLDFELTSLAIKDDPEASDAISAKFTIAGSSGESTIAVGDMRSFDQTYAADSFTYAIGFSDPDSPDTGTLKGALSGLSFNGTGAMPEGLDSSDMAAMLKAGLRMTGNMSYTSGNGNLQGTAEGKDFSLTTASEGGSVAVRMDSSNIGYDLKSSDSTVAFTSAELPFPVSLEMAQAALSFLLPVTKTDEPQDFSFSMLLKDFEMSDMLWGLFDPAGTLPRDPATVSLDTTGKATLAFDMLDPEAALKIEQEGTTPGELNELDINTLLISMVGAKLEGEGSFTFDNSDLESFGGAPRPEGEMNLSMTGANGLIDKLVEMGFVSSQDAMGARMMMGMLAVPGEGPDSLKSKIEINEQGHISANGQRLK